MRVAILADLLPKLSINGEDYAVGIVGYDKGENDALAGVVLWASVSEEVDAKIREQIKAGVFPVRLAAADWTSGSNHWLLDVIAPMPALATSVLANMKQVVKDGDLRIHPVVTRLVEKGALDRLGVTRSESSNA